MRTRDDRGAAAPEYIAILLIAAMFTSAVAVGVKPEWVQQKVCQALAVIFGKGSCAPASQAKPPAQQLPKRCLIHSDENATSIYAEGKITWVTIGGEGGYGYHLVEYSDGKADVELFYNVGASAGAAAPGWSKGPASLDASITGSAKYTKGETVHYDSVAAARADRDSLNKYARERALAVMHLGSAPDVPNSRLSSTSRTVEVDVKGKATLKVKAKVGGHGSADAGASGSVNGIVQYITKRDSKTGAVTHTVEALGSANGDAHANAGATMGNHGVKTPTVGGHAGLDDDTSVSVTKDNSGKITELVITKSGAEGADFGVDGDFKFEPGKPRLVSGPGKPRPGPGPVRWKPEPNKTRDAGNNEGRHNKQGKGSTLSKKPGREEESDGDHKSRETTTIRVAVNDQNRSQVEKWLGDNDVGPSNAVPLLVKARFMNPLDADATNDFAKFLYQSEDTQIDTQTSSETSDLKDDSYDILVAKVGEKDARESSSSTGRWVISWRTANVSPRLVRGASK